MSAFGEDVLAGQAIYSRRNLAAYDVVVLGFSNRWIWKCPTRHLLKLYNRHVSGNHLEVGVGTGYFLDRCTLPTDGQRLALLDLNQNCLAFASRRLRRYAPELHRGSILDPIAIPAPPFDSVGMNYVLHCLPGNLRAKAAAFDHLKAVTSAGAVIFGSTVLGDEPGHGLAARALMAIYNRRRIFSNARDTRADLCQILAERFSRHEVQTIGSVTTFVAWK